MMEDGRIRVTVIDMQPITPAVGGGRLRLLGLYHALGSEIDCTYVGSFDWPGESYRDQQIRPGLREIVVPLSQEHHQAASDLSRELGGVTVIDAAFPMHAALSAEYLRVSREHIHKADVVIFSHPWCYPPLKDELRSDQLVVYDSHNVEILLKTEALGENHAALGLLKVVAKSEHDLLRRSNLILTCSALDSDVYQRIFDIDPIKLRIVPNGTFVDRFPAPTSVKPRDLREHLNLPVDKSMAIFLGSNYGPNKDAALFIARVLAPKCPNVLFVVAGGVGQVLAGEAIAKNVLVTGEVDDNRRDDLLLAADFALNPMAAGSGTNIKMFDYMAAGLPILTTEVGARGIGTRGSAPIGVFIEPLEAFAAQCNELVANATGNLSLKQSIRDTVSRHFAWERISKETGRLLTQALKRHRADTLTAPRVAILSTWNLTCGIGEHAVYLADALIEAGAQTFILGNTLKAHQVLGFERDLHLPVSRVWHWDNQGWSESVIDLDRFISVLDLLRPDMLIVQHHTAFVPFSYLEHAIKIARFRGISVVVEMHDARKISTEHKNRLGELGAVLVFHHPEELVGLEEKYLESAHVISLPIQRARHFASPSPATTVQTSTVGGFGFLRPYKGLIFVIRAMAILRRTYPTLRYRGWHAEYVGDDSAGYLRECMEEADRLGIRGAIDIDTRFLSIEEIIANLEGVDAVLMPYEPSEEGGSAAINIALAAGRPIVASPSSIFRSVSDVVCIVERHEPEAYADAISRIISDPSVAEEMYKKAMAWAEGNSYNAAAGRILALEHR
jgi:glycosyltransferase involved in cell wall biosynthesis